MNGLKVYRWEERDLVGQCGVEDIAKGVWLLIAVGESLVR